MRHITKILCLKLCIFVAIASNVVIADESVKPQAPVTSERLINADAEVDNWLSHGRTYDESRFSPLTQISKQNIDQLGLAWSFEFDDNRGLQATPLVVDGVMYSVAAWSVVYAHNAKTGELLWRYDPQVPKNTIIRACCGPVSRGVAVWGDWVYLGAFDGHLIALNRYDGSVLWRVQTVDTTKDYTITGAPRIVGENVVIGNGGADLGVRGYVSAYNLKSGDLAWRFYTVPGNPALGFENDLMAEAAKTWTGEWWTFGGGGTVWDSMSYDPALNLLYIGVGNGSPWNQSLRSPGGGDNLFLSSIVALNATTGAYVWHYQTTPGESWDYTATQQIILADIEWPSASGKTQIRKVLMQAPKNGFFFIIDRESGEFLSAKPFTDVRWASGYDENGRPIEVEGARSMNGEFLVMPSALGGHNWHSMAYSSRTGLVYIPVIKSFMMPKQPKDYNPQPHHYNSGVDNSGEEIISPHFMQALRDKLTRGELVAWDPVKQAEAWKYQHQRGWNGGVLVTATDLVFQGTADQKLMAFDANSGEVIWQQDTQLGIVAAPISYRVDGEQYIAVMAKWGGGMPIGIGLEPLPGLDRGRLLVYKLGGTAALPKNDLFPKTPVEPPAMPDVIEEQLQQGAFLYGLYCSYCHGSDVVSNGIIPDLRHMNPGRHMAFKAIVLDGILDSQGMVSFRDVLTEEQADNVYAYILQQAHGEFEEMASPLWWRELKFWFHDRLAAILVTLLEMQ